MLSYAAYKNTRLPPIVNRPMVELGGGLKLGKPVLGSSHYVHIPYDDLQSFVLNSVNPKPKSATKYNPSGLSKPLHPDPLIKGPFGVSIPALEFVNSVFEPETPFVVPKFIPAVLGSFPSLEEDFKITIYSEWTKMQQRVLHVLTPNVILSKKEASELKLYLNTIVELRAKNTRKFINAALALYKGVDVDKLPRVVGPWIDEFFSEISSATTKFVTLVDVGDQ
jgi:hypothetical protein